MKSEGEVGKVGSDGAGPGVGPSKTSGSFPGGNGKPLESFGVLFLFCFFIDF